jgi:hypothetical protein
MTTICSVRADTQAPFTQKSSWSTFDLAGVDASAVGFATGAFDGRYVYFVPNYNGATDGVLVRYDTKASFSDPGSFASFDVTTVASGAAGFFGAVFDGRYLYLVPGEGSGGYGIAVRYDTQAAFDAAASYETFDVANGIPNGGCFSGGAFDGKYVYFTPSGRSPCAGRGVAVRYDTGGAFDDLASWKGFDVRSVVAPHLGFLGTAFDGRYLYFAPGNDDQGVSSLAARYDTTAPFDLASSWRTFDLTGLSAGAKGYAGATFDGRYVYFAPDYNGTTDRPPVLRVDTQADFAVAASWSTFSLEAAFGFGVADLTGAAFDAQAVYFAPNGSNTVPRFAAKTPPSLPPWWSASFF